MAVSELLTPATKGEGEEGCIRHARLQQYGGGEGSPVNRGSSGECSISVIDDGEKTEGGGGDGTVSGPLYSRASDRVE
jgi:hypothetical protein